MPSKNPIRATESLTPRLPRASRGLRFGELCGLSASLASATSKNASLAVARLLRSRRVRSRILKKDVDARDERGH
jgi:hypothetical protein